MNLQQIHYTLFPQAKRSDTIHQYIKEHHDSQTKQEIFNYLIGTGFKEQEIQIVYMGYDAETVDLISGIKNKWNLAIAGVGVIGLIFAFGYQSFTGKEYETSYLRDIILLLTGITVSFIVKKKGGSRAFLYVAAFLILALGGIVIILLPVYFFLFVQPFWH